MSLFPLWNREKSLRHVTMVAIFWIQKFCCYGNMTSHFSLLDWSQIVLSNLKWNGWIVSQRWRGVAWENSRHFATSSWFSKRNDVWETSAEMPYQCRVTTQIWEEPLIGHAALKICLNQSEALPIWAVTRHQYGISALVPQTSFRGKPVVASRNVSCFLRLRANGRNIVGCYMLRLFAHPVACCCAKFETGHTFSPVQTDATLLANNPQHCWELLRPFARSLRLAWWEADFLCLLFSACSTL